MESWINASAKSFASTVFYYLFSYLHRLHGCTFRRTRRWAGGRSTAALIVLPRYILYLSRSKTVRLIIRSLKKKKKKESLSQLDDIHFSIFDIQLP